jgi:hypothetical protein
MNEMALKRKILEQTHAMVKTNRGDETLVALGQLIGTLGELLSVWTGEVVRVRITAEGQPDKLDMVKRPPALACRIEAEKMNDEQIKAVLLAHGFTVKPGNNDLKPYVYEAARALLAAERERWTEAVMAELDDNGQAHAIVAYATRA